MRGNSTEKKRLFTNETDASRCGVLPCPSSLWCRWWSRPGILLPTQLMIWGIHSTPTTQQNYTLIIHCVWVFYSRPLTNAVSSFLIRTLCPLSTLPRWKRYPKMFISKYKIKTFHCISGDDYPVYMPPWEGRHESLRLQGGILLRHSLCERLPKYWFADTKTVCRYNIDHPLYMMKSTDDT